VKTAGLSLRRIWIAGLAIFLLTLACATSLFSQSLTVFGIDASAYPTMRAKFYAFDASGNQLTGLSPGDIQLREDGIARTVTRVSCPPVPPPQAISSVLTIDISGSMVGERISAAQAAARAWIEALPLGRSECAVTSFDDRAYVNQDFTTDRPALLRAVEALNLGDMTDYDAAFLAPHSGALEVCKGARSKRVVMFLSDGQPNREPRQSEVIAEANRQHVSIHAVILGMPAPQSVRDICAATGGLYFEDITTEAEAANAYRRILHTAQDCVPCEVEWTSAVCGTSRTLEVMLFSPSVTTTVKIEVPSGVLSRFVYTPSRSLRFGAVAPGTQSQQQVTLTAQGGDLRIDAVTLTHPCFSIVDYGGAAPPFTLSLGQSRTLRVKYAPVDSTYAFCRIEVRSGACLGAAFYANGGWSTSQAPLVSVKVLRPNGLERFVAGSEEELTWEDVMPEEKVTLEYSTNGGANWRHITDEATGLRHNWRVPKLPSDLCLLRVTAVSRPNFIGDMALIPAGSFRMGNITNHPDGTRHEKPVHEVIITQPFLISRKEVTQYQYEIVMGSNPSFFKGPDLPVELVTWYDAVEFCNELSRRQDLDTCYSGSGTNILCDFTANGYRLPTEAEWEYACRAGTETDFHTGNLMYPAYVPLDPALDRAGWYYTNSGCADHNSGRTHPVGEKEPNAFGLYDMHGNVWEWCWDWLDSNPYASGATKDPRGPASGSYHILRGGSWGSPAGSCRSARRSADISPDGRQKYNGFRVVRTY